MKYRIIIDKDAEEEVIAIVHAPNSLTQKIEEMILDFSGADGIVGYRDDEMKKLLFSDIECVTVLDRKVIAIDKAGNHYRIPDRLRGMEEVLPSCFIRINKSTLANEHCIERFETAFSGGVDAVFKCGWREYVSRRCFAEIRRRYEGK